MTAQRILTAAILIPLVVAADLYGPTWLIAALVALIMVRALSEFFDLAARAGTAARVDLISISVGLLVAIDWLFVWDPARWVPAYLKSWTQQPEAFVPPDLWLLLIIVACAVRMILYDNAYRESLKIIGASSAALLFVALPFSYVVPLHAARPFGPRLLLFVLLVIWVGDTFAYFVGCSFGRHPMAPRISPKKTWEGAIANFVGSVLVGLGFSQCINLPATHLVAMAALGNVAGQLGDLAESVYKRAAKAKDSSNLLPGHGGILDRIDSLIFAAPIVWYYFSVVVQRYP